LRFVTIHAFDRQTDGRTDRRTDGRTDGQTLIGKTALHTMQRGKNDMPVRKGRTTFTFIMSWSNIPTLRNGYLFISAKHNLALFDYVITGALDMSLQISSSLKYFTIFRKFVRRNGISAVLLLLQDFQHEMDNYNIKSPRHVREWTTQPGRVVSLMMPSGTSCFVCVC